MPFEFDPAKSAANKAKHGIDFEEAQALWNDARAFELPSRRPEEVRFLVIGAIDGKVWTAIITHRGKIVRIISVRRARPKELRAYESQRPG